MNLYHWDSKLLEAYGTGDIVVMAETVEEAREKIYREYQPDVDNHPTEEPYLTTMKALGDEDFPEEKQRYFDLLEHDLNQEPEVVTTHVVFIRGSD